MTEKTTEYRLSTLENKHAKVVFEQTVKEFEQIDKEYTNNIWLDSIEQKVFSFKQKLYKWLQEDEKEYKRDHSSRNSTRSTSSKSKSSTPEKAVEKNRG